MSDVQPWRPQPSRKTKSMPDLNPTAPKAFISYSWDDDAHKDWVKQLAARLRREGVEVTLDRWHSAPGDQIPRFMERAVRENSFVIAICTPKFKERSDERKGGVGYEGDIMTAYALKGADDKKFIPVLRRGSWDEAVPTWLLGRAYVDLSKDPYSESAYEDLLQTLLGTREKAPRVGALQSNVPARPEAGFFGRRRELWDIERWFVGQGPPHHPHRFRRPGKDSAGPGGRALADPDENVRGSRVRGLFPGAGGRRVIRGREQHRQRAGSELSSTPSAAREALKQTAHAGGPGQPRSRGRGALARAARRRQGLVRGRPVPRAPHHPHAGFRPPRLSGRGHARPPADRAGGTGEQAGAGRRAGVVRRAVEAPAGADGAYANARGAHRAVRQGAVPPALHPRAGGAVEDPAAPPSWASAWSSCSPAARADRPRPPRPKPRFPSWSPP